MLLRFRIQHHFNPSERSYLFSKHRVKVIKRLVYILKVLDVVQNKYLHRGIPHYSLLLHDVLVSFLISGYQYRNVIAPFMNVPKHRGPSPLVLLLHQRHNLY